MLVSQAWPDTLREAACPLRLPAALLTVTVGSELKRHCVARDLDFTSSPSDMKEAETTMDTGTSWNRPRVTMATSCRLRQIVKARSAHEESIQTCEVS